MKRILLMVGLAASLPLGGCVTAEQVAAQDDAACASYGYQQGTPGYGNCRIEIAQIRLAQRQQAIMAMGQAMQNAGRAMQPPPTTHTTCIKTFSNQVDCTSS